MKIFHLAPKIFMAMKKYISGWRHPFLGRYRVAHDSSGRVLAADVELYNNAGWTMDLSFSVMERAMFHSDNCYQVPNLR